MLDRTRDGQVHVSSLLQAFPSKIGPMQKATVITFDADGTLWDFRLVMRRALSYVLVALREAVPVADAHALTVDDMVGIRDEVAEDVQGQGVRLEEIRRLSFERALQRLGTHSETLTSHLTNVYFSHRFTNAGLYSDTRSALDALRGHYRLGLISNGNSDPIRYGLAEHFEFTVNADDCGVAKPDAAFYQVVLERAGVPAGEVIHVGDSLVNDVQGAQSVGIHTVWLNRHGEVLPPAFHPGSVITDLTDLPPLLTALGG